MLDFTIQIALTFSGDIRGKGLAVVKFASIPTEPGQTFLGIMLSFPP